jgi:hypothetical protein
LAKVYVSSTIIDLQPERQAVLEWLRLARHQAVDSYLPDSDTVRESCLEDVGNCDLYVLILGHRYGFQPEQDNPEGLSITQLEYRRAGECGIPRVALLRTSIPDVRLSDLQDPARAPLVLAFRDEVSRQVRPAEFSDLQGLVQGLSTGIQGALDKLDRQDERQAGQRTAGRVLRLAPRPVFLAGREELLAELEARLAGDDGAGRRVVALCGLGGAGKTSVAVEYAHRQLGDARVAWQFPAENPAVLAAGFGELAAQLGAGDSGDPVAAVHGLLAASPAQWLLVFDNAPDRGSVAPFVPPAGRGRVLITSRNQIWPPGQALDVPVLDPQVAAEFLAGRTGDADRRSALELAGELGGLPLALEQAAAYVQASGESLAAYLASFLQRRPELLSRGEPTGYPGTVATTWRLAFEDLQRAAPGAVGLLRLLAFCAPEAIPLRLVLQPRPDLAGRLGEEVAPVLAPLLEDRLAAGDAIAALRRYSLISPPADGSVSVHRLVQAVTVDQMPAELAAAWQQAAAALVEAAIPAEPWLPAAWPACAALLPHARAVLGLTSGGMLLIALYLGHSGSYAAARDLFQLIADAHRDDDAYGPEHPDTLIRQPPFAGWPGRSRLGGTDISVALGCQACPEQVGVAFQVRQFGQCPVQGARVVLEAGREVADDGQHGIGQAGAGPAVGVGRDPQHLGGGLALAVEGGVHERPEEVGEVVQPGSRVGPVPVDDRYRDHVAEDEVGLGQVGVAGDLGAGGELGAIGEVVHPADQPGPGPYALFGKPEPVVGWGEAVDERQDLAAAFVHSEKPRCAAEPAVFEVGQQPVNPVGAGLERAAHGVADAHYPRRVTAGQRQFLAGTVHSAIIAGSRLPGRRPLMLVWPASGPGRSRCRG